MLHEIWKWLQFNFLFGLICLAADLVVSLPLLLTKSLRERFLRSAYEIETISAITLVIAIVVVGLYNHFGASGT
ncbi:hypothetical protein [Rhodanobacter panaciterrae]|uniref:hypothetical protein n=1 Tax=Rhodanobacter panaciterrae TaxID=490572 RepID=UPI001672B0E6|nr:hypothetical protein [Rhodanobacter panaciterrae]